MSALLLALQAVPRAALYWAIVVLAGLLAGSGAQLVVAHHQRDAARLTLAQRTAEWAQQREAMATAARQASEQARAVEQQRAADLAAAQEKHDADVQQYQTDAARSAGAAERLRVALAAASAALRRGRPGDPTPAAISEAGSEVAELFGQCVDRYRSLGVEADKARAAGQQCERTYQALTR